MLLQVVMEEVPRSRCANLTTSPCFLLANHNDWSRLFAISSSHLFAVPISVLQVGLKKQITTLGCEKYFCRDFFIMFMSFGNFFQKIIEVAI